MVNHHWLNAPCLLGKDSTVADNTMMYNMYKHHEVQINNIISDTNLEKTHLEK